MQASILRPFLILMAHLAIGVFTAGVRANSCAPIATPPQPLSLWLFDDGDGATAIDWIGENDGALEGGMGASNWNGDAPFTYPGNFSLAFDGSDDRVRVSPGSVVSTKTESTVSAWFRATDPTSRKEFAIYGERDECSFNVYILRLERRLAAGLDNGASFGVFQRPVPNPGCGIGSWESMTDTNGIPTWDAWHHVVGVVDTNGSRLYLDGELISTNGAQGPYTGSSAETTIGHAHVGSYDAYWEGLLDEVAVWNHALTDDDVTWLHTHSLVELLPPQDSDGDGDVDLTDFLQFADCLDGPETAPSPTPPWVGQDCLDHFDADCDGDIDLQDFAAFQGAFSG